MKKSFIFLTLFLALSLPSCGSDDYPVESKPLEIHEATVAPEELTTEATEIQGGHVTTRATTTKRVNGIHIEEEEETTTRRTTASTHKRGAVSIVTRDGNVAPSHGNVNVPTVDNPQKTTKSTKATKTTKTTSSRTTTTTTTVNDILPDVTNGDIICHVTEKGVEILKDGKTVQLIETDTESMLEFYNKEIFAPSTLIDIADFDFDGHDDLFIPQEIGAENTFGIYFRYDTESESFTEWEEMADIRGYVWTDEERKQLHTSVRNSATAYESWSYEWDEEGKLVLIAYAVQYESESGVLKDYFEYPDGEETLKRREKLILDDEGNIIDTEEIPLEGEKPTESTETTKATTKITTTTKATTTTTTEAITTTTAETTTETTTTATEETTKE